MVFTSYSFLGFLIVVFFLYYSVPLRIRWWILLGASLFFFYSSGGAGPLLCLLAAAGAAYCFALWIETGRLRQENYLKERKAQISREEKKVLKKRGERSRRRLLLFCLFILFTLLALLKYSGFALAAIRGLLSLSGRKSSSPYLTLSFSSLIVPIGISFYTLQTAGYVTDVFRGTIKAEKNPLKLLLFVCFFPQMVQGPISRYGKLSQTLYEGHRFDSGNFCLGLERILWGYFKKLVIADRVMVAVRTILGDPHKYGGAYLFAGMLFYTLGLYADFTGGIDITIGVAKALGVILPENFNLPYFSGSLREYWRRWHITMCSWFRDYVFYPLSTSKAMRRFTSACRSRFGGRSGHRLPVYVSSFAVWFATGLWHGAGANFIVWGLCNWAILMISEELEPLYRKFHEMFAFAGGRLWRAFSAGRTLLIVCFLNLFDCYSTVSGTIGAVISIFTARNWGVLLNGSLLALGLSGPDYVLLAAGCALMLFVSLRGRHGSVRAQVAKLPYPLRFAIWYGLFLVVLLTGAYGAGYDASQFIYNRF